MVTANGPGRPLRDSIYRDYYVRVRGTSGLEILLNFICAALFSFLPFLPSPFLLLDLARMLRRCLRHLTKRYANGETSEEMYDEGISTKIASEENKRGYDK